MPRLETLRLEPAPVRLRPMPAACVDASVPQQKSVQPLTRLFVEDLHVLAGLAEVPQRFLLGIGDTNRGELAGAIQPREVLRCPVPSTGRRATPITCDGEKDLVRWLMICTPARELILGKLGLASDALCFSGSCAAPLGARRAPQFECKRVKVKAINEAQDRINKLQGVAEGVRQANELYNGKHAFHQTWLAILTKVAAAEQHERNIPMRGLRSHSVRERGDMCRTTFRQIVEFLSRRAACSRASSRTSR